MRFVLVHGWGFHAGIWNGLIRHLPGAEIFLVDLGFVSGGSKGVSEWPADAIAIGHSLGLLWLLEQGGDRFRALVSIQGFDCFCCHIPRARVASMRRGLERDASGTLQSFWRASGTDDFASPDALNVAALDQGLGWLMDWDAREAKAGLQCPMLALASRDDAIVPEAMSETIWNGDIVWSADGGHVLPLKHPDWCAKQIIDFADEIPS